MSGNSKPPERSSRAPSATLRFPSEEQKAINEEALSVNEEYQSTNEELLTSKEELQSLNEELTALNSQLQETLERQRTTSNDLQNVLYSTDVATLFLDTNLNIRFFTPATKSLFSVIPERHRAAARRPQLAGCRWRASDRCPNGAGRPSRRSSGRSKRRAAPGTSVAYCLTAPRTTGSRASSSPLPTSPSGGTRRTRWRRPSGKRSWPMSRSRVFSPPRAMISASRCKRLPCFRSCWRRPSMGERAQKLVARLDETLGAMSGMLNTLLDINQIEAGTVRAEMVSFPINDLLDRLRDEFTYHAQAKRLALRVVPCGLSIHSDPRLLEQMIRNLLSNALKYTKRGKVLLGCRRREGMLSIEIWDTGVGIPDEELQAIFEEYHQLDNAARERSRGLGLGLSIVQRLGNLLGHRVRVRSHPGKGSVFAIEVMLPPSGTAPQLEHHRHGADDGIAEGAHRTGAILVVEDDPEVRDLLELVLKDEGHRAATAPDGIAALELVARGTVRPDLILADYNLPNGMDGLQVAAKLREKLHREIPVIILTGDISTGTLRDIALQDCVQLNKPVKLKEMTQVIQRLLAISQSAAARAQLRTLPKRQAVPGRPRFLSSTTTATSARRFAACSRKMAGPSRTIATCEAFLEAYRPGREACLLIDAYLPGMNGLELLQRLSDAGHRLPAIMITGNSDVPMAVQAMKAGASDFIEKPIGRERTARQRRARARAVAGCEQAVRLAGDCGGAHRGPHAATAPDHGDGPRRPSQQEYRRGPRHQPTHGREPSRLDHEENRLEVSSGVGPSGACRCREWRRRAARSRWA